LIHELQLDFEMGSKHVVDTFNHFMDDISNYVFRVDRHFCFNKKKRVVIFVLYILKIWLRLLG